MAALATRVFWKDAAERAAKSAAQAGITVLGLGQVGVLDVDWANGLSVVASMTLLSLLTSVASSEVGAETASLVAPPYGDHSRRDGS